MQRGKIVIAILALIFFILTVVGFIKGFGIPFIILFILCHSLCLLGLSYIFSAERNDYTGTEELQQELSTYKSETETEIATMQRALDTRERELSSKTEEIERLIESSSEKDKRISDLKDNIRNAEAKIEEMKGDTSDFLPPGDMDESVMLDIIAVAKEAIADFAAAARKAGVNIRISSAEESLFVKADRLRLRIMFRNIIDNSIKYMKRAGSLVITISTIDNDIFIVCKDTGEGLPEEETKHIFELNYQGSNRLSGNGLGLTQAKAIVEYYGGTIYGRSTPDKGMGIYIQIPSKAQTEKPTGKEAE